MHEYSNKPTVDVLLATFNGERYLEEQLDSLDRQEDVIVNVWANDDGSVDETLAILSKWQSKGLIKDISKTERVGSTRAFLKLLSDHSDSEYVAFCDQDDIWEPNKLIIQLLNIANDKPACVTSQRLFIDSTGKIFGASKKPRKDPSFENAIIENFTPGNTLLMNNQAINLINRNPNPSVKHYDSWIYLLITFFGKVEYVHQPLLRYRIHQDNHVGLRKYKLSRILDSTVDYLNQLRFFVEVHEIDLKHSKISGFFDLILMVDKNSKLQKGLLVLKSSLVRQRRIDQFGIKLALLLLIITSRL